jgi:hypothetical protein
MLIINEAVTPRSRAAGERRKRLVQIWGSV